MEGIKVPCKISENSKIARGIFSGAHPLELGPQGIPEALRAAQGDLESTFVRSKTMPGPQKVENLENSIFFSKGPHKHAHGWVLSIPSGIDMEGSEGTFRRPPQGRFLAIFQVSRPLKT